MRMNKNWKFPTNLSFTIMNLVKLTGNKISSTIINGGEEADRKRRERKRKKRRRVGSALRFLLLT